MEEQEMSKCPICGQEMENADYLEAEDGFESQELCMNEECLPNK